MKRNLILREYQIAPVLHILKSKRCVLAITPNGGKTEISIEVIMRYLIENPSHRVLILTHSTNVLLNNFLQRLGDINISFTYSKDLRDDSQVHVCLPHSENLISGHYDFLIVDEAHDNYLASRVQRIIANIKPTKELLLTGTPSRFIADGGYDVYAIGANEISHKWFAKLNIELVASDYDWMKYYNVELEVTKNFNFNIDETRKTLESIIPKLIDRLKTQITPEEFNHPSLITKLKIKGLDWGLLYKKIGRTLIVAKSIQQAELINCILLEHKVDSVISHSNNDTDNIIIDKFKRNEHNVLVVVNKARLGYSDNDLMNLIDMSGTHNPDIIYQMFMRVVRGNPMMQKFYLKVTPKNLKDMHITHSMVCLALMLIDKKYLMNYKGIKKIKQAKIITLNRPRIGNTIKSPRNKLDDNEISWLPDLGVDIFDGFNDILHDLNNPVSIYKVTTFNDYRGKLGLNKIVTKTFEELLISASGK